MKKQLIMTFGRFNPPTKGHQKLFEKMDELQKKSTGYQTTMKIFLSQSEDQNDNPLSYQSKYNWLTRIFPSFKSNFVYDPSIRTLFQAIRQEKYDRIDFVFGQDRVDEMEKNISLYLPGTITHFHSSGDRTDGLSATKLRQFVQDDNFDLFFCNLPFGTKVNDAVELFKELSQKMKVIPKAKPISNSQPANPEMSTPHRYNTRSRKVASQTPSVTNAPIKKKMTRKARATCSEVKSEPTFDLKPKSLLKIEPDFTETQPDEYADMPALIEDESWDDWVQAHRDDSDSSQDSQQTEEYSYSCTKVEFIKPSEENQTQDPNEQKMIYMNHFYGWSFSMILSFMSECPVDILPEALYESLRQRIHIFWISNLLKAALHRGADQTKCIDRIWEGINRFYITDDIPEYQKEWFIYSVDYEIKDCLFYFNYYKEQSNQ